jgi:hypothetical protein
MTTFSSSLYLAISQNGGLTAEKVRKIQTQHLIDDDYRNWEYEHKRFIVYSIALLYTILCLFYQRLVEIIKCRRGDIHLIFLLIPELTCHIMYKQVRKNVYVLSLYCNPI